MRKRGREKFYLESSDALQQDRAESDDRERVRESDVWGSVRTDGIRGEGQSGGETLPSDDAVEEPFESPSEEPTTMEYIHYPEPVQTEVIIEEPVVPDDTIYVKIIREVSGKRLLLFDKNDEGYLTEEHNLVPTSAWQPVSKSLLTRPYGFDAELDARMPTKARYQRALWREGLVDQEDLNDRNKLRIFDRHLPKLK